MIEPKTRESKLRIATGFTLWAIAGVITSGLYVTLAGTDPFRIGLMLVLAAGLESSKILCWRSPKRSARILAYVLIILSLFAGLAASVEIVETNRAQANGQQAAVVEKSATYLQAAAELAGYDRQINILVDRVAALPATYTTAAANLNADIKTLRSDRAKAAGALQSVQDAAKAATGKGVSIFRVLAELTGAKPELFELIILVLLTIGIEGSGLVLAGRSGTTAVSAPTAESAMEAPRDSATVTAPTADTTARDAQVTASDYLAAAKQNAKAGRIAGYRVVRDRLGISDYKARKLRDELVQAGRIAGNKEAWTVDQLWNKTGTEQKGGSL